MRKPIHPPDPRGFFDPVRRSGEEAISYAWLRRGGDPRPHRKLRILPTRGIAVIRLSPEALHPASHDDGRAGGRCGHAELPSFDGALSLLLHEGVGEAVRQQPTCW